MNISIPETVTARLKGYVSRGVKAAAIVDRHLILTLTDDSSIDLGQVVSELSAHASTHANGGVDALTPAAIGAAAKTHASTHASGGADAISPSAIGAAAKTHASAHAFGGVDAISPSAIGAAAQTHAASHAFGGADALGAGSVSSAMLADGAVGVGKLAEGAVTLSFTVSVDTVWSGSAAPYTKIVSVAGMLASYKPFVDLVPSAVYATAEAELDAFSLLYDVQSGNGSVTLYASEPPETAMTLQLEVHRK